MNLTFTKVFHKFEDIMNFLKHIFLDNIFQVAFTFNIFTATFCSNPIWKSILYSSSYFLLLSFLERSFCLKRLPESFPKMIKKSEKIHSTVYNFIAAAAKIGSSLTFSLLNAP